MTVEIIRPIAEVAEIVPPPSLRKPPVVEGLSARMSLIREWDSKPEIGRQRWESLRYLRRGGKGRGPCGACDSNQEAGHHGGSKCRKRGTLRLRTLRFNLKPRLTFNVSKSPSKLLLD